MRILIADDDGVSRLALKALLTRHGHEVTAVTDGTEAWEILKGNDPPRLAILDGQMERMDGVEVCRLVREQPRLRSTFLIILTSRSEMGNLVAGLDSGANDYLTKPFDPQELIARIRVGEQMIGLQSELAARIRELDVLNNTDALTGIANRRALVAQLDIECERANRYGAPLAIAMLDLDRFKSLNDTYGHQYGDEVLKTLGTILSSTARATDLVARYGGEEFVIILANTDANDALAAAEKFRAAIESHDWLHQPITASFGVSSWGPGATTAADLMQRADKALYASKHGGRNRSTLWIEAPQGTIAPV
ncbi:MAG: diguanylate cyclase [Phycisphaerae bacterium]|nr:diguanylate cyclase [Phycisphaerae bacterium]